MTLPLEINEPAEAPVRYLPEGAMIDLLARRYTKIQQQIGSNTRTHRYAFADHVPSRTWAAGAIADFVAIDCQTLGSQPHPVHWFEVKASRSDWLKEQRKPWKAEAFLPYADYAWLVVSDMRIIRDGELPEGWGLLVAVGQGDSMTLRQKVAAHRRARQPMPWDMTVSLARAIAKSARAASRISDPSVGETA